MARGGEKLTAPQEKHTQKTLICFLAVVGRVSKGPHTPIVLADVLSVVHRDCSVAEMKRRTDSSHIHGQGAPVH